MVKSNIKMYSVHKIEMYLNTFQPFWIYLPIKISSQVKRIELQLMMKSFFMMQIVSDLYELAQITLK